MVLKYFSLLVNELRVIPFYSNMNGLINNEISLTSAVSLETKLEALHSGPILDDCIHPRLLMKNAVFWDVRRIDLV
jgi:hypothetical protein